MNIIIPCFEDLAVLPTAITINRRIVSIMTHVEVITVFEEIYEKIIECLVEKM